MAGKVETKYEMLRAGYKFLSAAKCKACQAPIEWWLTTNKKKIPYDPMPASDNSLVKTHWETCPNSKEFHTPKPGAKPVSVMNVPTFEAAEESVRRLRESTEARIVVAIFDCGSAVAWREGIPGEDLRHELITEANKVRRHVGGEVI